MSRLAVAFAVLTLPVFSAIAAAQPSPERGTVFIGASGFAAIEKDADTSGLPDADRGGTVAGAALSVGVHLTPRVSARFEWGLTDRLKSDGPYGFPLAANAGLSRLDLFSGIESLVSFGPAEMTSIVPANYRQERETMTGFALLGYHLGDGRVSLEVLGGLGFVNQEIETGYDVRILLGGRTSVSQQTFTTSTYHAVGVVGVDVNVTLTDHASVVPSIRAFSLNNGLSLRPGLGLRWTF